MYPIRRVMNVWVLGACVVCSSACAQDGADKKGHQIFTRVASFPGKPSDTSSIVCVSSILLLYEFRFTVIMNWPARTILDTRLRKRSESHLHVSSLSHSVSVSLCIHADGSCTDLIRFTFFLCCVTESIRSSNPEYCLYMIIIYSCIQEN